MERVYDKPSLVEYEGVLQKNRNKRPTCDQRFLEWCKENSIRFGSYEDMGKKLGMDGSCFKRLMNDYHMELVFDPKARMTPKLYKDKDWLFHEVIELNKKADQIAKENGWTPRVVKKWMGILGINNNSYKNMKKLSDKQKELISFSLLGDGCIATNDIFIVSHSIKQKDYLFWKYYLLKDLCNKEPSYYAGQQKIIRGKEVFTQPCYRFGTKKITELGEIRNKPISEIINSLNNFGISIWFLDDGYRGSDWELCVASYTEEEKQLILSKFNQLGFPSAHLGNYDPRYLYFSANDSRKIDEVILEEIPNELDIIKYKILENDKIKPERGLKNERT